MKARILVALLAACTAPTEEAPVDTVDTVDTDRPDPEDTGEPPVGEPQGSCEVQPDNALRVDCVVTTPTDQAVTLSFDGRERHSASGTSHPFTLWGLHADTEYDWTATSASGTTSGTFTTGIPSLPLSVAVTGASTASHLLYALDDAVIIADTDGRVLWYQVVELVGGVGTLQGITGYDYSEEDELVVLHLDARRILAYDLEGHEVLRLDRGVGFDDVPVHHDLHAASGRFHTLFAERVAIGPDEFVLDGVLTFAYDGTLLDVWRHADHLQAPPVAGSGVGGFWVQEFPGATEWGHANSVSAVGDDLVVSLRYLDRAYRIDGSSGDVLWSLVGTGGGGDFTIGSAPGVTVDDDFIGQHHVAVDGDVVTLFDNRVGTQARTVALTLDELAGTATITETHKLDQSCSVQGGNYFLPSGNVLATCAPRGLASEFAAGSDEQAEPIWTMTVDGFQVNRFIPIDLPL